MSKRLHCIAVLFIFIANENSYSQMIEWSNQQKVKSKIYYSQVLGQNSAGIFLLRSKTNHFVKELTLERYKTNLSQELSVDLAQPSGAFLERMVLLESGILVFASKKNNETGKIDLVYWKLDDNLNALPGPPVLLVAVNQSELKEESSFYIRASADKKKFSVMYLSSVAENKEASVLNIHLFNDQLTEQQKKSFPMSYGVFDIYITSVELDNEGNLFSLIDFPKTKEKRSKEKGLRKFSLYGYYADEQNMLEYDIGKDSVFITDLGMTINNYDKSIAVAGLFSYGKEDNKSNGSFFYKVNTETTKLEGQRFEDFDKSFVNRVIANMQNETTGALSDLFVKKIIPRSDGGAIVLAEKYYESRQTYTYYVNGFPQTSSRTVHNYDQIIVLSKKADGTTQFNEYIKKKQTSISDGGYYSSFVLLNANDKLSLIYNSDINDDSDIMISTINPKGETDTRILIKALSYYVTLMPPESRQLSATSVLISTLKDKRFSLLRVSY